MPLSVDNSPSTGRRRVPGWLRGCGRVLGKTTTVVLPLLLLAVGLVYLKLYHSPISLSFMVDPIQRVLNEEMPGVQIQVEDAILQRTSSGGVELRLTSVRVTEDSGSIVALASRASVQLSFSALRKGRIVPSRIDLLQPRVVWFGSDRSSYMLGYGRDLQGRTLSMPPAYAEGTVPPRETEVAKTVTIVEGRIDAVRRLTEMATEMRRRKGAASFLETFGLKDASFIVSDDGQQTVLRVPTLELSMRHSSWRSIISGSGTIASDDSRPFSFKFRTEDSERQDRLTMTVDVEDFVPRSFALGSLTPKGLLSESIDLPIAGNGRIELSRQGDVLGGTFDVALGTGQLHLPWLGKVPLDLSGGQIKASYAGDGKRLTIEPSTIRWRSSHATLKGMVEPATGSDGAAGWRFEAEGIDGRLTAEDLGASPLPLSSLVMRGVAFPQTGFAEISEFRMAADKATVAMSGTIAATGQSRVARLDGKIGPMSLDALKTMWPQALAPLTRTWVAQHVVTGRLKGGSFSITNKRDQTDARDLMSTGHREVALTLDAQQLGVEYLKGLPPIEAPEARLTVDGSIVVLHMPTATVRATPTQQLQMQDGSLTVTGVGTDHPQGRIDAQVTGPAAALLDLADRPPLGFLRNAGIDATGFDGKLDARFAVAFPMRPEGTIKDVQIIDMKANVVEGQGRKLMGRYSISGASIRAEARDNTIDVTGEALLEGVLAKIGWRHVIGGAPTDQQNLRIRATLGSSERAQLGIHVGDMLSGDMVVDLTVRPGDDGPGVRAAIDLTGAELAIPEIAWTKPPGQRAELRFDLGKRRDGNVLLQNFRLDGDTIGVNGWVALGPDNRPIEYMFPDFSLNTVSNLNVRGTLRADRIWDVKATGARFDARDVFRGFLTVASHKQQQNGNQHHSLGIDLDARVDTISGVPDTTSTTASDPLLRGVHLRLSRRGPDLQDVQFSGRHDNGRTLKATLKATPNAPRILVVEAADAGEALTLIGIYRNMQGGEGKLEINLDGAGAAARRGVMTVRRFHVIGDQVVSDVVDAYDVGQPAIQNSPSRPRRVVREQIEFDRMRTAFATGHGQLVIEDMEVTGPILSATIRGTLDYRSRQVQLGGTYTPLSGLNRALSSVPLFGEVFTGPRKEGVVAMTFAIQGPMANPQVIPNPLSLVAPGFLREIFQMAPQNPTITPSRAPQVRPPPQPQTTASQPATGPSPPPPEPTKEKAPARPRAKSKPVAPAVSDGWAATTDPRAKPAERN
jgi:hypothetical protein